MVKGSCTEKSKLQYPQTDAHLSKEKIKFFSFFVCVCVTERYFWVLTLKPNLKTRTIFKITACLGPLMEQCNYILSVMTTLGVQSHGRAQMLLIVYQPNKKTTTTTNVQNKYIKIIGAACSCEIAGDKKHRR